MDVLNCDMLDDQWLPLAYGLTDALRDPLECINAENALVGGKGDPVTVSKLAY